MSPFRRLAAGATLAVVAILAAAAPAYAHDQLISSTPAEGEQLDVAPERISMTFSGPLIVLDSSMAGAVVMVVDESGRDWVRGGVDVQGESVTAELATGMPDAGYQVRWQVVSQDGHPISGVIPFTVGDAEPMTTAGAAPGAADSPSDAEDQVAGTSSGSSRMLLIGAGGAAIAAAVYALYLFFRRSRAAKQT